MNLSEPASGTTGWAATINANFSAINAAVAALQAGGATGPAGPAGAAGAVGMIFAGQWATVVNYVVTDVVTFNGSSYIAIANNVNSEPDTHPGSWALLAAAGAAGPAGPTGATGPQGPAGASGGGSTVTFPITVAQGGTGAATAAAARTNLGAAASGANSDITNLTGITGFVFSNFAGPPSLTVGSGGTVLSLSSLGVTCANGVAEFEGLVINGGDIKLPAGSWITSSSAGGGPINLGADPGLSFGGPCVVVANDGLVVSGPTPSTISGQLGIGATTASTASAGGGQAVPATVLAYLVGSLGGVQVKIALFAA